MVVPSDSARSLAHVLVVPKSRQPSIALSKIVEWEPLTVPRKSLVILLEAEQRL